MSVQNPMRTCLGILLLASLGGCSLLPHELQPSQLRKLNRGPSLGRDTANFSIPDPQISQGFSRPALGEDPFQSNTH